MKRFLIIVCSLIALYFVLDYTYYHAGWYIPFNPNAEVNAAVTVSGNQIYMDRGNGPELFEIKGVDIGAGMPGEWATDFAITKDMYLRWFKQIQDMGANTVRIYTVHGDAFYNAFYEYNKDNPNPLYLLHGVWVNDYVQNSHADAYDSKFKDEFQKNCYTMVNVIHGNCKLKLGEMASSGSGSYRKDISPWVIGYILGVEWEDQTVAYTNEKFKENPDYNQYHGKYMYSSPDADPFEALLANIGDHILQYETKRYHSQRLMAFSNWPTTDPLDYPEEFNELFRKCAQVDVEHIKTTDLVLSGQFASYHVYPYFPDYLDYLDDWSGFDIGDQKDFVSKMGTVNSYRAYLTALVKHHTLPVIISEFGVSTARGMAQRDANMGRNQGHMSESDQGEALVSCYEDIKAAGCAGSCIFSWQDEWFKRTWNTMYSIDMKYTPYWSDYQTNEQYFGLLSFDPGKKRSICYVNGMVDEWSDEYIIARQDDMTLSMKYDEKFIYFYVHKPNLNLEKDTILIPIDVTPNSGSTWCKSNDKTFDRPVDFLITIHGKEKSKIQVQEYYEALRSNFSERVYGYNTYFKEYLPESDSPEFVDINLILRTQILAIGQNILGSAETYETGKLTYGNADPNSEEFNSLADFMVKDNNLEIKLPWQILNFTNPSDMEIQDDHYNGNYGVDYMNIDRMYVGIGDKHSEDVIRLEMLPLVGWHKKPTFHERLKSSYYVMQELWTEKAEP